MPRFALNPKFTYTMKADESSFKIPCSSFDLNGAILYSHSSNYSNVPILAPTITLPNLGNSHSQRKGQRITVTSIRWKSILWLADDFKYKLDPWSSSAAPDFATPLTSGSNVKRFFKFRYMCVQFDEDLPITLNEIYRWFKRTYCWYGPNDHAQSHPDDSPYDEPVSVHSNMLRVTTPWIGKFNVLMDRCFTLTTAHPELSLDITIPVNRTFMFDEDTQLLIRPNIWCFILGPLAKYDMDAISAWQLQDTSATNALNIVGSRHFIKMNFIDL